MAKLIVGLDIDEILAPFTEYFLPYYNKKNNTDFKATDIAYFELEKVFGGTGEDVIREIFDFYRSPDFQNMSPVEGSQKGTSVLKKKGYKLVSITSRPEKIDNLDLRDLTLRWLESYFPSVLDEVHFTSEFVSNGHKITKADVCKRLGVGVFVEDRYGYAKGCALAGIRTLLYDCPWNKDKPLLENMIRVYSWQDILDNI